MRKLRPLLQQIVAIERKHSSLTFYIMTGANAALAARMTRARKLTVDS